VSQSVSQSFGEKTPPTNEELSDLVERAAAYFKSLQERICASYEAIDGGAFEVTPWTREPGEASADGRRLEGGGERRILRGTVFEKTGVNFSNVRGSFDRRFRQEIPGAVASDGAFTACGISLVSHMANPYVPTVHMNLRLLRTSQIWFGGGADLTPTFPFEQDTQEFHTALKSACDTYRRDAYAEYKKWCDEYFYLPHRQEPRGVGGIFFDQLNSGDRDADFAFVQAVGEAFFRVYPQIVRRRMETAFGETERNAQLIKRGRYVEFNLVYDRGTKFGFATGADPENYLMSMPPLAKW